MDGRRPKGRLGRISNQRPDLGLAIPGEPLDQVAADKAGGASDKDFHIRDSMTIADCGQTDALRHVATEAGAK